MLKNAMKFYKVADWLSKCRVIIKVELKVPVNWFRLGCFMVDCDRLVPNGFVW